MTTTNLTSLCGRVRLMRPERLMDLAAAYQSAGANGLRIENPENVTHGCLWAIGGKPRRSAGKSIAVLPLSGMIDQKMSMSMLWMGGTSTEMVGEAFDSLLADPDVKGIILDCDSPGGTDRGVRELSDKIYAGRSVKPVVAISNSEMNSACYWLGSAASRLFGTPGSSTGSIGVWAAAMEYSKALANDGVGVHVWRSTGSPHKAEFLPWMEFSQEAIAHEQVEIDACYDDFVAGVARNRGLTASKVKADFGKGRPMSARQALAAGLIDRIATLPDVIRRMESGKLSLSAINDPQALDVAFADDVPEMPEDESWRDVNATARAKMAHRRRTAIG